jgi:xanthine/CO dehydrogenase XdhC/CoxF family maturation factor
MTFAITVHPAGQGWAVSAPDLADEIYFISGGKAEAAARALARRLARAGKSVELEIVLRDGSIATRALYPSGGADRIYRTP